ncbi:MAG: hypothetical protein LBH40_02990, partial [Alphaproteobacteria bacterium]|nr:hypothetical protein [Alphaproteobacteria bacterium]
RDGFAIRTLENRELSLSIWDSWLATAYSDNPKELTDEEVEFINENSSIDDRENTQEYKKLNSWYRKNFYNKDSEFYKHWKDSVDLMDKYRRGVELTEEEIARYNSFYCRPFLAVMELDRFKKGGLRNNDFADRDRDFGLYLKYSQKEKEAQHA